MDRLLELTCRAEQSHFWFRGFRWFVQPEVARAVRGLDAPTLLDCGCGTGANVAWLRQFGVTHGFDLTWNGLVLGRQLGRQGLARASLAAVPVRDATIDVATSFDVFQCLPDPVEEAALAELWRVLKPGGRLILNVAALDALRGPHSTLSEEVRRYTPARLRLVVERAGFTIDRLTFVYASLFPLMLLVRTVQRWRKGPSIPAGEFDITVPPWPINMMLTGLVGLEAAALRVVDLPVGSSLLCHARKPS
ncbi:MAG: class I SAM-dependent methyltransferase [Acidobacteriota bacterium]